MTSHEPGRENPKGHILVIDDSPIIRNMLVEVLGDEGYHVDTAVDGSVGIECAMGGDYTVIICDVHMPKMNGLETVREILSYKSDSKIILTDSFPDKLARQAREEGALCCLQKPFDLNELRSLIEQVRTGRTIGID